MNGKDVARLQPRHHVRPHMRLAARDERKIDASVEQPVVQGIDPPDHLGGCGVIHAGKEMRRAGHDFDAILICHPRHLDRHRRV